MLLIILARGDHIGNLVTGLRISIYSDLPRLRAGLPLILVSLRINIRRLVLLLIILARGDHIGDPVTGLRIGIYPDLPSGRVYIVSSRSALRIRLGMRGFSVYILR